MVVTVRFLRVSMGFHAPVQSHIHTAGAGLMHFHFPAFQSIIDNMTLSESEITEYGDPLWSLRTTAEGRI